MGVGAQDCGKCGQAITGKAMKVKETAYCAEKCFSCTECMKDLKAVPTYSRDDKLFCERCYREKFVPKCSKCNEYVLEVCYYFFNIWRPRINFLKVNFIFSQSTVYFLS